MPSRIPAEADAATRALLEWVNEADPPPLHAMTPDEARQAFDERRERVDLDPEPVARVEDRTLDTAAGAVPIRVYGARAAGEAALPVVVYYHGGGFVIGNLDSHDSLCRRIANGADCLVVAVDYRLAPEHPYPAAPEDAVAALDRVAENAAALGGDGARIAVAGDSAGGTLAALAAHHARDRGSPELCAQILIYPALDPTNRHESTETYADVFPIDRAMMAWFYDHYYGDGAHRGEAWAAPGLAENLSGLAPATILTAGMDPLRDEGAAYAERLARAGIAVDYRCYDGTVHGFLGMGKVLPHAERALAHIGDALRAAFGR